MRDQDAMLRSTDGRAMALAGVTARGTLRGLLFELDVEQRWRNPSATNIEAVYTFPLPLDAVLLDLAVEIGGRRLAAAVVEKRASERRYEEAIDQGDSVLLLERAGDGLYTLNLGNLMAGETAVVRYRYAHLLAFAHGSVRLAIPTVIAPRYGNPARAGLAPQQVPENDLAVAYPFALAIDLQGEVAEARLASPSHAIATQRIDGGIRVSLARDGFLDRDFVLELAGLAGRTLASVARDGDGYVALASFCADAPKEAGALPLRVKLLVDCSGSMNGDSIEAARRALHRVLAGLQPTDRFSFSRFGSTVVHETNGLVPADGHEIRAASERLSRMGANLGGTEMAAALQAAFAIGDRDAADVLVITDGESWDAQGIVERARAARQRVFAVGIGSAPAEGLLRRLAEASGGACEFVAPNEDAEGAIVRMFARLRAPRIDRADIAWPASPAWTTPLPSGLFGGETIHAFAGFRSAPAGRASLCLTARSGGEALRAEADLGGATDDGRTLARIAAAQRFESLPEAERLPLALDYALVTPLTNLLVVHERAAGEKAADLPALAKVAQMHAAGWHGIGTVRSVAMRTSFESLNCMMLPSIAEGRSEDFGGADFAEPSFEALRDPERSADRARRTMPTAKRSAADLDIPAFLRTLDDTGPEEARPVDDWLARLERNGASRLPTTLPAMRNAGAPDDIVAVATRLVRDGHDERDVLRAILEALGALAEAGSIASNASRRFLRALRHQFRDADEARELRALALDQLRRRTGAENLPTRIG